MLTEEFDPPVIQQETVGQDGDLTAETVQIQEEFVKTGIGQAFTAGQGRAEHSGFPRLMHQILPGFHRKDLPAGQLRGVQMDVAHFAAEVAQRRQLKLPVDRHALFPSFVIQITGKGSEAVLLFPALLAKLFDKLKGVQRFPHPDLLLCLLSTVTFYGDIDKK